MRTIDTLSTPSHTSARLTPANFCFVIFGNPLCFSASFPSRPNCSISQTAHGRAHMDVMQILVDGLSADLRVDESLHGEGSSTLAENVAGATFEIPVEDCVQAHFPQTLPRSLLSSSILPSRDPFYSYPIQSHLTNIEAVGASVEPTASILLSPPPKQCLIDEHGNPIPRILDGDTSDIGAAPDLISPCTTESITSQEKIVDFSLIKIDPKYVKAICRKYEGRGIRREELLELAKEGIFKAAERFDSAKGTQFQSYATWWIRERILDRFKRLKSETEYLSDVTKGRPLGSLAEGFEDVSVCPSYYRHDDTIDEELAEIETNAVEIPRNLAELYLDHICSVASVVMAGVPRAADYHRMLSSKPSEKWKESDIIDRQSNLVFLEAVVRAVMCWKQAEILLKRFGVNCMSFSDIGKLYGVTYRKIRVEFLYSCKDLVWKIRSPWHRIRILKAFRSALVRARMPVIASQTQKFNCELTHN